MKLRGRKCKIANDDGWRDEALMPHNVPTNEINSDMVRRLREHKNEKKNGL